MINIYELLEWCLTSSALILLVMISSKRALRKRILSIARMPRTTKLSAVIVSLLMLASILCTFTGAEASTWFDTISPFDQTVASDSEHIAAQEHNINNKL